MFLQRNRTFKVLHHNEIEENRVKSKEKIKTPSNHKKCLQPRITFLLSLSKILNYKCHTLYLLLLYKSRKPFRIWKMCWPFAFGYGLCSSYAIANWKDGTLLGSEKGMGKTQIFIFQWFLKAFPGNYALFEDNLYPSSLSPTKMRINFEGLLTRWCSFLSAVHQPHQYTVMHSWAYDWWHFMLISYSKSLIIILPLWLLSNPYGILHNFRFSLLSKIHQILFYQTCNVAIAPWCTVRLRICLLGKNVQIFENAQKRIFGLKNMSRRSRERACPGIIIPHLTENLNNVKIQG